MLLAARAWHLRQASKAALAASDFKHALKAAEAAEQAQHSQSGAFLRALAARLGEQQADPLI